MASAKRPRPEYVSLATQRAEAIAGVTGGLTLQTVSDCPSLAPSLLRLDESIRDFEDLVANIAHGTTVVVEVGTDPKEGRSAGVAFLQANKDWRLYYLLIHKGIDRGIDAEPHDLWPVTDVSRERKCLILDNADPILRAVKIATAKRAAEIDAVVARAQDVIKRERGRL